MDKFPEGKDYPKHGNLGQGINDNFLFIENTKGDAHQLLNSEISFEEAQEEAKRYFTGQYRQARESLINNSSVDNLVTFLVRYRFCKDQGWEFYSDEKVKKKEVEIAQQVAEDAQQKYAKQEDYPSHLIQEIAAERLKKSGAVNLSDSNKSEE